MRPLFAADEYRNVSLPARQ